MTSHYVASRAETYTEILIVGAGPAGLTLAALLARAGVPALTITRHRGTAHSPRAHITNQRTMEILRDLGIEDQACGAGEPFAGAMPDIVWATSFAGTEIARVRARGAGPERLSDYAIASPCSTWNIPQHRLEPILLAAAREAGAQIQFGRELTSIETGPDGVLAEVYDRQEQTTSVLRATRIIGADGGASTVAQAAGFEFEGRMNVRRALNVWVAADLSDYCAYRPANIYGIHQPGRDAWMGAGLWVCVTPWREWVVSRFTDGDDDPAGESIDETEVRRWLHACIGADVPIRIKDIGSWSIHDAVATSYRRGPVLLVGDAAHRHPPVNGLGTNTSMQDAYNLAWKLALVASGRAGERLIDTYDDERRPVGLQVVRRSWRSAENSRRLGEAIGLTSEQTLDGGLANLAELRSAGEQGRTRRAALQAALRETGFQFNAQGVELGQRYASAAVVGDDRGQDIPRPPRRDPELYYDPTATPGACLPHAWIEHDRRRISTLDVPSHTQLTLLTGAEGDPWLQAVRELAGEGLPIVAAAIGYRLPYDDVYGDWQQLRQVDDAGCVLVRPDRYIAWRSASASPGPLGALRATLKQVLQLPCGRAADLADRALRVRAQRGWFAGVAWRRFPRRAAIPWLTG